MKRPSSQLIVEGSDDQFTIINLTAKHGVNWDKKEIWVENAKGCEEALNLFPLTIKSADRIGLVLDADTNLSNRWQAVCNRLRKLAKERDEPIELPDTPNPNGTIIRFGKRRIGIWLMPDNAQSGKLENFLQTLVSPDDCCWNYAGDVVREAHSKGADFIEIDTIKAHIHTWLAWQKEPGLPFGTAIKAAYFLHDTQEALAFVSWFKQLFEPETQETLS